MNKQKKSIVTGALFIAITLILFLPGLSFSGSLEPSDPPGPTMRTLDEIYSTNSWSQKIPCTSTTNCPRFEVLADFNNEAVLDKETGLVWQRSPFNNQDNWWWAQNGCIGWTGRGGRHGWRVPTIHEFQSLVDDDAWGQCGASFLPCGHPFTDLNDCYWSSTAWPLDFNKAFIFSRNGTGAVDKTEQVCGAWCVRGGIGVEFGITYQY
jgi:hypothetical protein